MYMNTRMFEYKWQFWILNRKSKQARREGKMWERECEAKKECTNDRHFVVVCLISDRNNTREFSFFWNIGTYSSYSVVCGAVHKGHGLHATYFWNTEIDWWARKQTENNATEWFLVVFFSTCEWIPEHFTYMYTESDSMVLPIDVQ